VQTAGDQQPADSEQQQAHGQVDACAHRAWSLDGIGVEDEHMQQADRQGQLVAMVLRTARDEEAADRVRSSIASRL